MEVRFLLGANTSVRFAGFKPDYAAVIRTPQWQAA